MSDAGLPSLSRIGTVALATVLTLVVFATASVFEDFDDAPLFLFAVPLGLAAIGYGVRGGIGMGVLTSLLAVIWWVQQGQPDGASWPLSRTAACLGVGVLLGWLAGSRQALTRALEHHRMLSLDMIATADYEGYFTDVNPAFTRTLGFSAEELTSRPFMDFVHPDDREPTLAAVIQQTEQGREVLDFQNRYRTKAGEYRWLEWTSSPDPEGRSLIAVARDVTDRKRLEELEHEYQIRLERNVRERTKELNRRNADLEETRREMLRRLALAAEYRDDQTYEHTERVGRTSALLAEHLGLREAEVQLIRDAAPLHDIGKLGVSDTVLLKPGKLTFEEMEHVKLHAPTGAAILSGSTQDVLRTAEEIALGHHEWWDGGGYPAGLAGDAIPLCARIVAVADVFDALTHERPYKEAWPVDVAVAEIQRLSGVQFDPRVVDAFVRLDAYELAGARPTGAVGVQAQAEGTRAA